jgi:hypothetical protein
MRRLLVALVLLGSAGGTLSAQVSVALPDFGTLRAGETAKIAWTGLPQEVEELELLLSVEGRPLPIRVTPELAAPAGVLLWRVPNLPSHQARLTIRFGLDGEEVSSAPSVPFEILPAASEPPAALIYRDGEWWTLGSAEAPLPGLLGTAREADRGERGSEPLLGAAPAGPVSPGRGVPVRAAKSESRRAEPIRPRDSFSRQPVEVPARP